MASSEPNRWPIFLDASIVLDMILPDRPRIEAVAEYLAGNTNAAISPLSIHLAVHFGKKHALHPAAIRSSLERLPILPLNQQAVLWAFDNLADNDFEDALQVACAVLGGCKTFVTADEKLAKHYGKFIDVKLLG
jgi:predicted nucleic acid-binding protein